MSDTSDTEIIEGWYVSHDDELDGPLSDAELKRRYELGRYKPEHYVWRQGMDVWLEVKSLPQLAGPRQVRREVPVKPDVEKHHAERRATRAEREQKRSLGRQQRRQPAPSAPPPPPPDSGASKLELPGDLGKTIETMRKRIEAVPPLAIVLLVAGVIFPMLLPILWFFAWRVYSNSRQRRV